METWKMGWTPRKVSGSWRVKEWVLAFARISKGPRNFGKLVGWLGGAEELSFDES